MRNGLGRPPGARAVVGLFLNLWSRNLRRFIILTGARAVPNLTSSESLHLKLKFFSNHLRSLYLVLWWNHAVQFLEETIRIISVIHVIKAWDLGLKYGLYTVCTVQWVYWPYTSNVYCRYYLAFLASAWSFCPVFKLLVLWPLATTNCVDLWPQIASLWSLKRCGLWPQQTVLVSSRKSLI